MSAIEWSEIGTGTFGSWLGTVDGRRAYLVLKVGLPGPGQLPVFVSRHGVKNGHRCTNVHRAMELAEMNETMPVHELTDWGLALATS